MRVNKGFTLTELLLSMTITLISVVGLLQMLDWTYLRYSNNNSNVQFSIAKSEIRTWLREKITAGEIDSLTKKNLQNQIALPTGFFVNKLLISNLDPNTFVVNLEIYENKRNNPKPNPKPNPKDINSTTFCFRRRTI